jgi:predicted enzyme related to lactoylglutathione lyase
LFGFLRLHRDELFDEGFQAELESMYRDTGAGRESVPPALLAMAVLLQGYQGVSDAVAVEMTVVELRWQLVLGVLGATEPAFSQGTLCAFRARLIHHDIRVDDLDALLADLAAAGVWIDPKRQNESYGRFAWIKDCDGNRVELWQPLE